MLCLTGLASAQSGTAVPALDITEQALQAVISGPNDVAVGRTIVLDAARTRMNEGAIVYRWFVEGRTQPISDGVEAVYTPDKAGTLTFRLVTRQTLSDGTEETSSATHTVTVYTRKMILIADSSVPNQKLNAQKQVATDAGLYVRVIHASGASAPLIGEDRLTQELIEHANELSGADVIVLWTDGISGLQALIRAVQGNADLLAEMPGQTIVLLTDGGLSTLSRIAWGPFSELQPRQIIVTRNEALGPLFTTDSVDAFRAQIAERDIDFLRIDDSSVVIRPWNLLSSFVNVMLAKGVPSQTVILLLVLPVIAMILTFLKQVVGITTLGLYTPSIIALSFLALGWPVGVLFLVFIIITGYGARTLVRRLRLLYIPKVAIVLTVVSLTLLLLMGCSALFFNITFSRETIFILLIMSTLAESFLNIKTEQGWMNAAIGVGETILASLLCVFIVQWSLFQALMLAYPELIILTVIVDILLGKWTGLRLVEYVRFREVLKHLQEE